MARKLSAARATSWLRTSPSSRTSAATELGALPPAIVPTLAVVAASNQPHGELLEDLGGDGDGRDTAFRLDTGVRGAPDHANGEGVVRRRGDDDRTNRRQAVQDV